MSDDTEAPVAAHPTPRFVEVAGGVPTQSVNDVFGFGYVHGQFDVILTTTVLSPDGDRLVPENRIVGRIRFDLSLAKAIRDRLTTAITAAESPDGTPAPPRNQLN